MSAYFLFTAGILDEQRAAWATQLAGGGTAQARASLPPFKASDQFVLMAGPSARGAAAPSFVDVDELRAHAPDSRCIVFVEPPAIGLCKHLELEPDLRIDTWFAEWRRCTSQLLECVQSDPSRFLLVDIAEQRLHPSAFLELCANRFGLRPQSPATGLPEVAADPLCVVLALSIANSDQYVQAAYAELQASCTPLSPDHAWPETLNVTRPAGDAAINRLRDLRAVEQAMSRATATAPSQEVEAALSASRTENELLLLQLHQLHEELERVSSTPSATAAVLPVIERDDDIPQLLEKARENEGALRAENELLTLQIEQLHTELGHYHTHSDALAREAAASVNDLEQITMTIAEVRPIEERLDAPHRELTLILRNVRIADRDIHETRVRLVEHHGHPGLVIFGNAEGEQLVRAWRESGRENDRAYALLVPSDAGSRALMEAMDSLDWLALRGIASRIEQVTQTGVSTLWRHVARRFRQQLLEMPGRFRWSSVAFSWQMAGGTNVLACRFAQVTCGSRGMPALSVHWAFEGPDAGLQLLCDPDAGPPLLSWPNDAAGVPCEHVRILVRDGDPAQQAIWSRLTPSDRDFIGNLTQAWPIVAAQVPTNLAGTSMAPHTLATQAAAFAEHGRASALHAERGAQQRSTILRRIARRIARRMQRTSLAR